MKGESDRCTGDSKSLNKGQYVIGVKEFFQLSNV